MPIFCWVLPTFRLASDYLLAGWLQELLQEHEVEWLPDCCPTTRGFCPHSGWLLTACWLAGWLQELLQEHEVEWLLASNNGPVCVGLVLSALVARSHVDPHLKVMMHAEISGYINASGACERILKTGIPAAYTR